jgi:hypothetical protein
VGVSANANLREETAFRVYRETGREDRTRTRHSESNANANAKYSVAQLRRVAVHYDLRLTTYDLRNIL